MTVSIFLIGAAGCADDGGSGDEVGATESESSDATTGGETEVGETEVGESATETSTETTASTETDTTTETSTDTETTAETSTDTSTETSTDTETTGDPDLCGDAMVTGDEVCDDGINDGSYGGCAVDCSALADYCGDALVNGPETCDDAINGDIADGCLDDCTRPESCLDILTYDAMATDGEYLILPAGQMGEPFTAYCDMTTDGGGWTLAMRFAPANAQFHFYSVHWTTESVVNEAVTDPLDASDGKFPAFNVVPGDSIRGCMRNPMNQAYGCKVYDLPATDTLLDVFSTVQVGSDTSMKGLYFAGETQAQMVEWLTIQGRTLAQSSVPNPNYVRVGINIDDDQSCYDARVRFGLVLNNEANITTLNDAAGFGAQSYFTAQCDLAPGVDSGWKTASGFAAGPTIYSTAGQIWIR